MTGDVLFYPTCLQVMDGQAAVRYGREGRCLSGRRDRSGREGRSHLGCGQRLIHLSIWPPVAHMSPQTNASVTTSTFFSLLSRLFSSSYLFGTVPVSPRLFIPLLVRTPALQLFLFFQPKCKIYKGFFAALNEKFFF